MDGVRVPRRVWFLTLFLWSVGLHALVFFLVREKARFAVIETAIDPSLGSAAARAARDSRPLETRLIRPSELKREAPIVDSAAAPSSTARPRDRARYLGERTQRVERETVARGFGTSDGDSDRSVEGPRSRRGAPKSAEGAAERLGPLGLGPQSVLSRPRPPDASGGAASAPDPVADGWTREGEVRVRRGSADLIAENVAIGAQTLLNTDEYVHASFFNRVKREVAPRWEPLVRKVLDRTARHMQPGLYQTGTVTILDAEGNVLDVQVTKSSGHRGLDEAARTALKVTLRFPRPPAKMRSDDGRVRFPMSFLVNLDPSTGFQFEYVRDPRL